MLLYSFSININPKFPVCLAGWPYRTEPYRSIADDLEVNALLFVEGSQIVCLLNVDTLFCGSAIREALLKKYDTDSAGNKSLELICVSSHTHFAPSLDPAKPGLGASNSEYLAYCIETIWQKLQEATSAISSRMEECRSNFSFSLGGSTCSAGVSRRRKTLARRRRTVFYSMTVINAPNPSTEINHDIRLLSICNEEGNMLGVVWTWPCHPIGFYRQSDISADFPGVVRRHVREKFGSDIPVLFLPGFCGDVKQRTVSRRFDIRSIIFTPFCRLFFAQGTKENYAAVCKNVCEAVDHAFSTSGVINRLPGGGIDVKKVSLPLDEIFDSSDSQLEKKVEFIHLELKGLKFLFINAEVTSPYYRHFNAEKYDFVTGYTNEVFGYLPDDKQIADGGYEVDGFCELFSLNGKFKTEIVQTLYKALGRLQSN